MFQKLKLLVLEYFKSTETFEIALKKKLKKKLYFDY